MCRLIFCNRERTGSTIAKTNQMAQPGYLIKALPDGWVFSKAEQGPAYKIVDLPDVDESEFNEFLEEWYEGDDPHDDANAMAARRKVKIDLTAITPTIEANLANTSIAAATRVAALKALQENVSIITP